MRYRTIASLACPACVRTGRVIGFDVDRIRVDSPDGGDAAAELVDGWLVCRACRAAYPVLGGTAILPVDVRGHLATCGNVYRRLAIPDPRLARYLLGHAGEGGDVVPFEEVVARYGDLVAQRPAASPAPTVRPLAARDARLDAALAAAGAVGPSLEVGCGVGRGTFLLAARTGDALGTDRSVARVRRARNVQTIDEFRLPLGDDPRAEAPIELARLARDRVDFLVADPDVLPFGDRVFATVVLREGDGLGPFADADAALAEATRVTRPGGVLLVEGQGAREGTDVPFRRVGGGASVR